MRLVDTPALCPRAMAERAEPRDPPPQHGRPTAANPQRAKDQEFFADFYPGLKALLSKDSGAPYWKGALPLVDGSCAEVVAMEDPGDKAQSYSIATSLKNPVIADVLAQYKERKFPSARHAVLHLELDLNQALYRARKG
ncbi:MAG: hypothetical protein WBW73_00680 [Rhodoplanes sp.]